MQTVSVTLPNTTASVSGIVNGAYYEFALTDSSSLGTIWTAEVPRVSPDVYYCTITAVSNIGTSTTIEVTLFYGLLELITDRTQADVDHAINLSQKGLKDMNESELAEFAKGLRGSYNATDLNRVESAVQYVTDRLAIAGVYPKTKLNNSWSVGDFPVKEKMHRYLDNIRILRETLTTPAGTPDVPEDMDRFTYREANDIEKILLLIDAIITDITLGWMYCGEIYAGEV